MAVGKIPAVLVTGTVPVSRDFLLCPSPVLLEGTHVQFLSGEELGRAAPALHSCGLRPEGGPWSSPNALARMQVASWLLGMRKTIIVNSCYHLLNSFYAPELILVLSICSLIYAPQRLCKVDL